MEGFLKTKNKSLTTTRIETLNSLVSLGWSWGFDEDWDKRFAELKKYIESNKCYPKQRTSLGQWVSKQRTNYKNKIKIMAKERIEALESLDGWFWNAFDGVWNEKYNDLAAFLRDSNGRLPNSKHPLNNWVVVQRKNYKNKSMPKWRLDLMNKLIPLGWSW